MAGPWRICGNGMLKAHCICGGRTGYIAAMASYSIREAADLLGVSVDTARRWADSGRLPTVVDDHGRRHLDGVELARFVVLRALEQTATQAGEPDGPRTSSMRNRFTGIVTKVVRGDVAAQVEVQSGPHRFVSLLTREAVDELDLHEGDRAAAIVKATNVSVELLS